MPPRIKLESLTTDPPVEILQIDRGVLTVGREPENAIVVDSEAVSRRHGCISAAQNHWVYRDLQSTNGSWVNGVEVNAGQVRLLRSGDVVQLGDFPMRFTEIGSLSASHYGEQPPSLLVFQGDRFETEFPLVTEGSRFVIGGPEGHFFLDGQDSSVAQVEIFVKNGRLHLVAESNTIPVVVNDIAAVTGVTALTDRDEINLAVFKIVVNDARSAVSERLNKVGAGTSPSDIRPARAYDRANAPEHLQSRAGDGWTSEAARRRQGTGRKFVFGTPPEGQDPSQTVALRSREFTHLGYDLSSSQRFSGAFLQDEEEDDLPLRENIQIVVGIIVFAVLLGVGIFYLTSF